MYSYVSRELKSVIKIKSYEFSFDMFMSQLILSMSNESRENILSFKKVVARSTSLSGDHLLCYYAIFHM